MKPATSSMSVGKDNAVRREEGSALSDGGDLIRIMTAHVLREDSARPESACLSRYRASRAIEASDTPKYSNCANLHTTLAALPKAPRADPTLKFEGRCLQGLGIVRKS